MTTNQTPEKFIPALMTEMRRLADEDPNFIYTEQTEDSVECSYLGQSTDEPHLGRPCIVGQAMQNLGVTKTFLETVEGDEARDAIGKHLDPNSVISSHFENMLKSINKVQDSQDRGAPWGEAVRHLDRYLAA